MIVDIVMLVKSKSDYLINMTKDAIKSLHLSETDHSFNVILLESGNFEEGRYSDCIYIKPDLGDFNYNRYMSYGIGLCTSDYIGMANNDLIFYDRWFSNILSYKDILHDVMSFCCWNGYNSWHNNMFPETKEYYIGYGICSYLSGWFILVKKEVFDIISLDCTVNFWGSDSVYQDALIKHNIKHALMRFSCIDHITSATLNTCDSAEAHMFTVGQQEVYRKNFGDGNG
jgi:hypothetical protein